MANLELINGGVTVAPEATTRMYGVKDPTGTPVDIQFTATQLAALLLASAALTGTPTAPTATPGTDTTQVATTAFVKAAVDALIAAAPGALDTLDELAAALGDDANFAATVTTALAGKQPLDSDLTDIAALTTTSYGRSLLTTASNAALRAAVGGDAYVSGGYYMPMGIGVPVTPSAGSANTIYFHPFIVANDVTIDSLVAKVAGAAASGLVQMAIYAAHATTRLPTGAPLYSGSSQSTTSAVVVEDTGPSLALSAGLYWAASNKDTTAAAATFISCGIAQFQTAQRVPAQTAAGMMTGSGSLFAGYNVASTFNTWPTLTGSYAGDGLAHTQTSVTPAIGFKAA